MGILFGFWYVLPLYESTGGGILYDVGNPFVGRRVDAALCAAGVVALVPFSGLPVGGGLTTNGAFASGSVFGFVGRVDIDVGA